MTAFMLECEVVHLTRVLRPDLTLVTGGPEVSYEIDQQPICRLANNSLLAAVMGQVPDVLWSRLMGPSRCVKL